MLAMCKKSKCDFCEILRIVHEVCPGKASGKRCSGVIEIDPPQYGPQRCDACIKASQGKTDGRPLGSRAMRSALVKQRADRAAMCMYPAAQSPSVASFDTQQ